MEGGVPPFSVKKFPLTFWKNLVRGGPRGRGGVPPQRKVSVPGVFEPFPNREKVMPSFQINAHIFYNWNKHKYILQFEEV